MPTTSEGLRFPASAAAPNVPQDIQNLASDVNAKLAAARTAPVDLGLATGFANFGGAIHNACYWREGKTGFVAGTLRLTVAMAVNADYLVAGMPAGFRPTGTITTPTNFDGRFEVQLNGEIHLLNGSVSTTYNANTLFPLNLFFPIA